MLSEAILVLQNKDQTEMAEIIFHVNSGWQNYFSIFMLVYLKISGKGKLFFNRALILTQLLRSQILIMRFKSFPKKSLHLYVLF